MATDWLMLILLGGLLGTVGQGMRVIVGMKKLFEESQQKGTDMKTLFSGSTLGFSLLIGFVAGVIGALGIAGPHSGEISKETVITLLGIGYAGADFIEGFVRKYIPVAGAAAPPPPAVDDGHAPAVG